MEAITAKGEVFTVLPDGTVLKRVSSFREMFEGYDIVRDDWQVDFEEKLEAERRVHRNNKTLRKAKLEVQRGTVAATLIFASLFALLAIIG